MQLIITRNIWVSSMSLLIGKNVFSLSEDPKKSGFTSPALEEEVNCAPMYPENVISDRVLFFTRQVSCWSFTGGNNPWNLHHFLFRFLYLSRGQVEEKESFATIKMETHGGNGWSGLNSDDVRFELSSNHLMQIIDGKRLHLSFFEKKKKKKMKSLKMKAMANPPLLFVVCSSG